MQKEKGEGFLPSVERAIQNTLEGGREKKKHGKKKCKKAGRGQEALSDSKRTGSLPPPGPSGRNSKKRGWTKKLNHFKPVYLRAPQKREGGRDQV